MTNLTTLLSAARLGDQQAAGQVFGILYDEMRALARSRLRQHQPMTLLDTTALLHESYLRLVGVEAPPIEDKRHFFLYASTVMRTVIVDFARARNAQRRGGDVDVVSLDTANHDQPFSEDDDVIRVHEALQVLAQADATLAQIVELRYFGGLTESEVADILDISERTVRRHWEKAKLLLLAALQ